MPPLRSLVLRLVMTPMSSFLPPTPVGLCASCTHVRIIENRRGSRFYLCELSAVDPAFPRYPRLPVLQCRGYEPAPEHEEAGGDAGPE